MIKLLAWRFRSHPLRLATTTFAVALAVAFIAGTLVLTDTISSTFADVFEVETADGDVIVRRQAVLETSLGAQRTRIPEDVLSLVLSVAGTERAAGSVQGYAQFVDPDGDPIGSAAQGRPTLGMAWRSESDLQAWRLVEGRAPTADAEVVVDRRTAEETGYRVGDVTTVLLTDAPQRFVIVGIAAFGVDDTMAGATVALFELATAQRVVGQAREFDRIVVRSDDETATDTLIERLDRALPRGAEAVTAGEFVAENESELAESLQPFRRLLTLFTGIALFVGSFLIHNTFTMTVAQRRSELGLLRALGASRGQLMVAVLAEAAVLGVVAAIVGAFAGMGVAIVLESLLEILGFSVPPGSPVLRQRTIAWSLLAGVGVTMAAAALPARQAGAVSPIAAMRRDGADGDRRSARQTLAGIGALLGGVGLAAAAIIGWLSPPLVAVGAAGALVVIGAVLVGPMLAGPVARVLGRSVTAYALALTGLAGALASFIVITGSLVDRFVPGVAVGVVVFVASVLLVNVRESGRGVPGLIGRENIARNPRRSSTTAAALMTGVAVVASFLILASSLKASINALLDDTLIGDLVVTSDGFNGGLSVGLADTIATLDDVETASGVQFNFAEILDDSVAVPGVDTMSVGALIDLGIERGSLDELGADGIGISNRIADRGLGIGDAIDVTFATTGTNMFTVRAIYTKRDLAGDFLLDERAFDIAFADRSHNQIFIGLREGADQREVRQQIARILVDHPSAQLLDADQFTEAQTARVDQALGLVFGLLFLAILLALLGIGNTLALSILERTREFGVLRAIGMSREQLRSTVRWEAVVLALFGTAVGLVVGTAFGWVVMRVLREDGFRIIEIPTIQLALTATLGSAVGVAAAVIPERRAARLDLLEAIAVE